MVQAEARVWARSESKLSEPRKCSLGWWKVELELLLESGPWLFIQSPYTTGGQRPQGEVAPKPMGRTPGTHILALHSFQIPGKVVRSPSLMVVRSS